MLHGVTTLFLISSALWLWHRTVPLHYILLRSFSPLPCLDWANNCKWFHVSSLFTGNQDKREADEWRRRRDSSVRVVGRFNKIIISFFINFLKVNTVFLCHLSYCSNWTSQSHNSLIKFCNTYQRQSCRSKNIFLNDLAWGKWIAPEKIKYKLKELKANLLGKHASVRGNHAEDLLSQTPVELFDSLLILVMVRTY